MKLNKAHGIIIIVLFLSFFSVKGYEPQQSGKTSNQLYPKIYGDIVVWEDDRHGDLDIYGYNIKEGKEFLISTDEKDQRLPARGDQFNPAIGENYVVWQDKRNGNWDIYYRELRSEGINDRLVLTSPVCQITDDSKDQTNPAVYGDIVVWEDTRDYKRRIYYYNLLTGEGEFPIPVGEGDQCHPAIYDNTVVWQEKANGNWNIRGYNLEKNEMLDIPKSLGDQRSPAIYKGAVVWMEYSDDSWSIYGWDINKEERLIIPKSLGDQRSPAICEDVVVWYDDTKGQSDIYGCYYKTGRKFTIEEDKNDQRFPAVYNGIVVWMQFENDNWDIYGYNLSKTEELQLTGDMGIQKNPAIYQHIVVWEDGRDIEQEEKGMDIYGYDLLKDEEFLITKSRGNQCSPAIHGKIVVWEDNRNGNYDIYGYNYETKKEFQITEDPYDQQNPAIYGNYVVWQDKRNGNWDIYYRELKGERINDQLVWTSPACQITDDSKDQTNPAIYGDIVVWQDERNGNWDIYRYNLETQKEFPITENREDQIHPAIYKNIIVWEDTRDRRRGIYWYNFSTEEGGFVSPAQYAQSYPAIYGTVVVWREYRYPYYYIYGYDLSIGKELSIATNRTNHANPAIYKDIVVWEGERNGNPYIYRNILPEEKEFLIATGEAEQRHPAIYENIVVWEDGRNGNWDIYGYNLETKEEFRITTDPGDQRNPAIHGDYVVWEDYRHVDLDRHKYLDIYGYTLSTKEEFRITKDSERREGPLVYEDIVIWADYRDDNWDIYMYNLSTEEGEVLITENPAQQRFPALYEQLLFWCHWGGDTEGKWDIYHHDLTTGEEAQITEDLDEQLCPAVYVNINEFVNETIVIWEDSRDSNEFFEIWNIYGYTVTTGEFQITEHISDQLLPAVYGDIVVWQDSRNDNLDIYGYYLSTGEEFQITEDPHDQFYPAIYNNIVVWEDKRGNKRCIYYYDLSTQKESPIPKGIEEPESRTIVIAGFIAVIVVLALILGMYKKYPHLFKRESSTSTGEEIKSQEIYEVNPLKDPLSNFLFTKKLKYFFVLFLLIILQVGASISSETLTEIDVDSFPREKVPFLKEEVLLLPTLYEPVFIIYSVTAGIIFFLTRKFLLLIPNVFKNLFEDGIIRRKKGSTVKNVLADFNGSLRKFEKELNGSYEYVPGIILCILGCLLCCWGFLSQPRHIALGNLAYVSWRDFCFFRTNWAVFVVVSLSMFFILGIFIWKMYKVVSFIKQINNNYELVLKPYDVDGSGGFGPLEQLWLNMSFVAMPILVDLIILSILGHFWGSTYYPLGRSFDLLLTCTFIIALLVRPILTYHRIVENQKANLLGNIENKIDNCYRKIEKALSEEEEDLEGNYLNQLKQFQEIAVKVKSIPSLPLKTYQKVIIFLGAFMPLIINSIIGWSREVITWIMQYF